MEKVNTKTIKRIFKASALGPVLPGVGGVRAFTAITTPELDPFVMLDHLGPQPIDDSFYIDGTKHAHPHRGFETMTFLFEGGMKHVDSWGGKATLKSGSVQRMNAGSGLMHGGDFYKDKGFDNFHEVQLWVNNKSKDKMTKPAIQNASVSDIPTTLLGDQKSELFPEH